MECKKVPFKELNIGDEFWVWGDVFLYYDYPKACNCVKVGPEEAMEIDGERFCVSETDKVAPLQSKKKEIPCTDTPPEFTEDQARNWRNSAI